MKYLQMTPQTTLSDLADVVGESSVDYVLNANGLSRGVKIGKQVEDRDISGNPPDWQTKINILNNLVGDSDVYEKAALGNDSDWNALATYGAFPNYIKIPDEISVPLSSDVLGNGTPIANSIHAKCVNDLKNAVNHAIDPLIFSEYNALDIGAFGISNVGGSSTSSNPFEWFQLPWGKVSLYSSISGEMMDFPVYPVELSDGFTASYDQMPDMLYQYEPWQVYKESGPRSNSYTFKMHRDMWTGDHRDGLANKLIRFCQANCFPEYNGSAVRTPLVTFYLNSVNHITGVMTECKVDWSGPLGLDGFYLECTLHISITEVAQSPINYTTIQNRGLIE